MPRFEHNGGKRISVAPPACTVFLSAGGRRMGVKHACAVQASSGSGPTPLRRTPTLRTPPMDASSQTTVFEHDGWRVRILLGWDDFATRYIGSAELFLQDALRCRIDLREPYPTRDQSLAWLRDRAIGFIADWRRRDHGFHSEFSEL